MSKSTNCVIAIAVKAAGVEETEAFIEALTGAKITKRDDKKEGTLFVISVKDCQANETIIKQFLDDATGMSGVYVIVENDCCLISSEPTGKWTSNPWGLKGIKAYKIGLESELNEDGKVSNVDDDYKFDLDSDEEIRTSGMEDLVPKNKASEEDKEKYLKYWKTLYKERAIRAMDDIEDKLGQKYQGGVVAIWKTKKNEKGLESLEAFVDILVKFKELVKQHPEFEDINNELISGRISFDDFVKTAKFLTSKSGRSAKQIKFYNRLNEYTSKGLNEDFDICNYLLG